MIVSLSKKIPNINSGVFKQYNDYHFCNEYRNILRYANMMKYTLPSVDQQIKQNFLIETLIYYKVWENIDVFYTMANNGGSNFALINWKSPSLYNLTLVSSPTFTSNRGFKGNGTSSYVNTNWNPATNAIKYKLDSASRGAWVITEGTLGGGSGNRNIDGNVSTATNTLRNISTVNHRINQGTANISATVSLAGTGYMAINRSSSTNIEIYNGTLQTAVTATSTSITSDTQTLFNSNGVFSNVELSFYYCGGNIDKNGHYYINSAFSKYINSL